MKLEYKYKVIGVLFALLLPVFCHAHTDESTAGFLSGLLHPVFGLDHFLAMLSVGIVSAQLGGRRIWTIPVVFVVSMIAGAVLGIFKVMLPVVEIGIALSVMVLGIAVAISNCHVNSLPVMLFVMFFGVCHGHAHGLEMPDSADPAFYAFGFVLSTSSIHILGVGVGHVFTRKEWLNQSLRHLGSLMTGMGLMILLNALS